MRFSLQSLAICLVSTQAGFALAGPCRPLTTTSVGVTTTTVVTEQLSSTVAFSDVSTATTEEETSITMPEASTTSALAEESSSATLAETTTTMLVDESTTTTLAETSTVVLEEITTTTVAEDSTTTTAAETTTTAAPPVTTLYARYNDGDEVPVFLQSDGFIGTTETDSTVASFALEADTSRLYLTLPDGSKRYAYTVIPDGPNYGFIFETDSAIEENSVWHFITCSADVQSILTCSSEVGPTEIFWFLPDISTNFYGNMHEEVASYEGHTAVRFRLPVGPEPQGD
ncbi:uncharacterized protein B0J16DRAFT_331681 [Fusarium flagelliforme]|uniref:uncharacterized protein n=1 Tax=Fusarium flagelliforme TaxID=2675880 RepID=UPI001E8D0888|nr:uncharacterized protein B0J16DRAFT_331681 [Fusarium flagelliforme]KAH7191726.1 hypothetical protein B0J16DRAFT_331681 [Fusarium flagelliforme]